MGKTVIYAFRRSVPFLIGWMPVGLAYGVLMANAGYSFVWTGAVTLLVYAGSLQFLMITFFTGTASYLTVAVTAMLLNSRHIFYGLSFIEKFRTFGGWKYFLIYSLADENYSLHCAAEPVEGVNEKWGYVLTSAFLVSYWLLLSTLGTVLGSFIPFDMTGIDFAMTALFVVILVDQLRGAENRLPAVAAAVSAIVCLTLIGPDNFILPSLLITVAALVLLRGTLEKEVA